MTLPAETQSRVEGPKKKSLVVRAASVVGLFLLRLLVPEDIGQISGYGGSERKFYNARDLTSKTNQSNSTKSSGV